ncbi:polyphosphate polymerase domain-containing protein [Streptomyces sp. ISID311]|uniref:polyphosphate polymerase domain-containing protein n=1 Tax=Streptomyces sp. ISID311 TaxID=2601673 RepID=UPI0011BD3A2F|nr:polyphosphate polymerase domain-containing protein [Streptomyces sp. ISID311]TXC99471.1 polyphosphate polymerase domain-containing protein [Streptomyces sp. ISID311]
MSAATAMLADPAGTAEDRAPLTGLLGLDALRAASLAEIDAAAALQHRVDRKYLVPTASAARLVAALAPTHRVLDIRGRRTTDYRSTYFDTPHLAAWRAHVQGRRRRWKVRTRFYAEDRLCRVEVKTKDGRGATVKHALPVDADAYGRLDAGTGAVAFVDRVLSDRGIEMRAADLTPAGEVRYVRAALADLEAGARVTLDALLACHRDGRTAALDPGYVLIETKGGPRPAAADRHLLGLGARPVSVSKYIVGLSLLVPGLPDNNVRRLARTRFHTDPRTETPPTALIGRTTPA